MRAALVLVLCAVSGAEAQMYKCVDAKGATHYSDKPRADCRGDAVDIKHIPPLWGKVTPHKEDLKAAERDFQRRQIQRDREEAAEKRRLADQQHRCESLKAELQRTSARRRVPDGAAHEKDLARLESEVAKACR